MVTDLSARLLLGSVDYRIPQNRVRVCRDVATASRKRHR